MWDYNSTNEALLIDRGGKNLLVHVSKSGFVSVMDKHDGKLENVWPLVESYEFVKGIDPKTGKLIGRNEPQPGKPFTYCPSWAGGRSWNAGAYNPNTGLWYTNVLELCTTVTGVQQKGDPKDYGVGHLGADALPKSKLIEGKAPSRLDARDPITGERK